MTYRQIEASREARLWITEVIMPAVLFGATLYAAIPEVRETVNTKVKAVKEQIKSKTKK